MIDLWTYLSKVTKPIVMYGMGNGAEKILSVFEKYNIKVSDFFASDGFLRGHIFKGYRVLSFSEIEEKYDDFIIIVSFASSLNDVLNRIYKMNEKYELYAPDVPVIGENIFDTDFYYKNVNKINEAYQLLSDADSKETFNNIIQYKLSGKISYLKLCTTKKSDTWIKILSPHKYKTYVDLGAYNGDTIREILSYATNLESIVALEPDEKNYKKLQKFIQSENSVKIQSYNIGAWSSEDILKFEVCGSRNSNIKSDTSDFAKTKVVCVDSIDKILNENQHQHIDYIKYDVEGSENEALIGSKNVIKKDSPDLLVSLYHRSEDLFDLILLVHKLNPNYKLYLRRFQYIPAWDLNLYAIER